MPRINIFPPTLPLFLSSSTVKYHRNLAFNLLSLRAEFEQIVSRIYKSRDETSAKKRRRKNNNNSNDNNFISGGDSRWNLSNQFQVSIARVMFVETCREKFMLRACHAFKNSFSMNIVFRYRWIVLWLHVLQMYLLIRLFFLFFPFFSIIFQASALSLDLEIQSRVCIFTLYLISMIVYALFDIESITNRISTIFRLNYARTYDSL